MSHQQQIRPNSTMMVNAARHVFSSGKTLPYSFRLKQLKYLNQMLIDGQEEICEAIDADMGKPRAESLVTEIAIVRMEIDYQIRHLKSNMKKEYPNHNALIWFTGVDSFIRREPYGVVIIFGTWNFPCYCSLNPLVGAIAAGNCVIVKHSEFSSNTSSTLTKLMGQYLDNECYYSYVTDAVGSKELLNEKFDYIFFTGSSNVGRSVMEAAAKHLTPVTLELGGKSPVYIDDSSNIKIAVERILYGKCMNLGQVCLAPDYILCSKKVQIEFLRIAEIILNKWYGLIWRDSSSLGRIINNVHFHRLKRLLTDGGGRIALGGNYDEGEKWISPTIITDVKYSDLIMQEEIFGPILPILLVNTPEEAILQINSRPKPLALYVFTKKKSIANLFIEKTSTGGVCINDVIIQIANPIIPFGGVGESGIGHYHWKYSFDTFSHMKSVMCCGQSWFHNKMESLGRYPPYRNGLINQMMKFLSVFLCIYNLFNFNIKNIFSYIIVFLLGILISFCIYTSFINNS